jgi:hypothetical protein
MRGAARDRRRDIEPIGEIQRVARHRLDGAVTGDRRDSRQLD